MPLGELLLVIRMCPTIRVVVLPHTIELGLDPIQLPRQAFAGRPGLRQLVGDGAVLVPQLFYRSVLLGLDARRGLARLPVAVRPLLPFLSSRTLRSASRMSWLCAAARLVSVVTTAPAKTKTTHRSLTRRRRPAAGCIVGVVSAGAART